MLVARPALLLIRSTFNDLQIEGFLLIEKDQMLRGQEMQVQVAEDANRAKTAFLAVRSRACLADFARIAC